MSVFSIHKIKSNFFFPNEYICINQNEILPDCKVILKSGQATVDVTLKHLFLGYKPILIGIPRSIMATIKGKCELQFFTKDKLCGNIELSQLAIDHPSIILFEGKSAKHNLLSFPQMFIEFIKHLKANKDHPLYPDKNLYNQTRVAYSFPRKINVIVVKKDNQYNIFPTDLHGEILGDNLYIISLRENGKAYSQVMEADHITLSTVPSEMFESIYQLGKNHMQELKPEEELTDLILHTQTNPSYAVSKHCSSFIVLKKRDQFKIGIHNLITFTIEYRGSLNENTDTLAHFHAYYSNWRSRNNFHDKLLIRKTK